jgi:hypothetical protein
MDELPPPYPSEEEVESTSFVDLGALPPTHDGDSPKAATNTRFTVPALRDDLVTDPRMAERREAAALQRKAPAPMERRPTLTSGAGDTRAPRTVRPGVLEPVRGRADSSHRDFSHESAESSDVISSFSAGLPPSLMAQPPAMPPAEGRPRLERRPPRPAGVAPGGARPAPIAPAATQFIPPQSSLPLEAEHVSALIADQRRRLHVLFAWARGLEVAAGVLGTISLAVLVTSVVGALLATGPALLPGAAAFVAAAAGAGLALVQVVAAVALRQLAHLSAQQTALIEALCTLPRRGR